MWHNWWPMLTGEVVEGEGLGFKLTPRAHSSCTPSLPAAFMYVLVPMPALFFGGAPGSNLASSWVDAGKFLTGFSAVGSVAIPAILYHAGVSL